MIFSFSWMALLFVWLSGIMTGRGIEAIYNGDDLAKVYVPVSVLILVGVFFNVRTSR
jgi:hypothetical protein